MLGLVKCTGAGSVCQQPPEICPSFNSISAGSAIEPRLLVTQFALCMYSALFCRRMLSAVCCIVLMWIQLWE